MKSTNRWIVFAICSALFLMSNLYRASNAVIAPDLSRDLMLTPEKLGLLGAMFFYIFAINQIPVGLVLDHAGARRTMIGLNLVAISGAVVFAQSQEFWGGLAGRALLGLGMSANLMGGLKLYTKYFKPHEFATVSGLMFSVGAMGGLLAASPMVLLVEAVGWRGAFLALGLLNLALTLSLAFFIREGLEEPSATGQSLTRTDLPSLEIVWKLVKDPSFWTIGTAAGLRFGAFASIQTLWAGPFLMIHLGLPGLTAGNLLLLLSIGFILGAPLGGWLSDRVLKSRKRTVMISLVGLTVSVYLLANWPGPVHLALLGILFFFFGFCGSYGQIVYTHIKGLMPSEIAGTAMSGVNFFVMGGAGVFLQWLGGVLGTGSPGSLQAGGDYKTAFMLCFAALVAAVLIYALSRDDKVQAPEKQSASQSAGT